MEATLNTEVKKSIKDKGFTLIELLIVIVILGILSTITVFAVRGITDQGQASSCKTDKAVVETAVEAWYAQNGTTGPLEPTEGPTTNGSSPAAANAATDLVPKYMVKESPAFNLVNGAAAGDVTVGIQSGQTKCTLANS